MEENSAAYQAGYETGYALGGILGCLFMILIPTLFIVALILAIVKKSKAWTIVTVVTGMVGLLLVGVGAYFAFKEVAKAAETTREAKLIQDPNGQYFLEVPGNWKEQDLGSEDASIQVGNLFREEYLLVISEPVSDFDPGYQITDFADLAATLLSEGLGNAERGELAPVEINGLLAAQCRIEGTTEGIRIVYHNTYIKGADSFYQVMAWTLPSKEEEARPLFEEAVSTFQEGSPPADSGADSQP